MLVAISDLLVLIVFQLLQDICLTQGNTSYFDMLHDGAVDDTADVVAGALVGVEQASSW